MDIDWMSPGESQKSFLEKLSALSHLMQPQGPPLQSPSRNHKCTGNWGKSDKGRPLRDTRTEGKRLRINSN